MWKGIRAATFGGACRCRLLGLRLKGLGRARWHFQCWISCTCTGVHGNALRYPTGLMNVHPNRQGLEKEDGSRSMLLLVLSVSKERQTSCFETSWLRVGSLQGWSVQKYPKAVLRPSTGKEIVYFHRFLQQTKGDCVKSWWISQLCDTCVGLSDPALAEPEQSLQRLVAMWTGGSQSYLRGCKTLFHQPSSACLSPRFPWAHTLSLTTAFKTAGIACCLSEMSAEKPCRDLCHPIPP